MGVLSCQFLFELKRSEQKEWTNIEAESGRVLQSKDEQIILQHQCQPWNTNFLGIINN